MKIKIVCNENHNIDPRFLGIPRNSADGESHDESHPAQPPDMVAEGVWRLPSKGRIWSVRADGFGRSRAVKGRFRGTTFRLRKIFGGKFFFFWESESFFLCWLVTGLKLWTSDFGEKLLWTILALLSQGLFTNLRTLRFNLKSVHSCWDVFVLCLNQVYALTFKYLSF
jgi:hypothetical protein